MRVSDGIGGNPYQSSKILWLNKSFCRIPSASGEQITPLPAIGEGKPSREYPERRWEIPHHDHSHGIHRVLVSTDTVSDQLAIDLDNCCNIIVAIGI